jgi:uncharacterized membrane protein HdeD (DUF308 family)
MEDALRTDVRRAASWSLGLSLLMVVAGVLAIGIPLVAGLAVTIVVGWLLIASAALHFVFAWRSGYSKATIWEILLGLLYGFIGFYVLVNPAAGLASLTFALAIYLLVEGVLELVLSYQLRPAAGAGWLLFDGIITLVLAAMIWSTWPSSAVWVLGTLVGISMLFSGITRFMLSLAVRRVTA